MRAGLCLLLHWRSVSQHNHASLGFIPNLLARSLKAQGRCDLNHMKLFLHFPFLGLIETGVTQLQLTYM